jgi:thioester reductase-like protein
MRHIIPTARTIIDYLEQRAADDPDKIVYHFVSYADGNPVESTLSYRGLRDKARALAAGLQARGLGQGDRVIVPSLQMADDFIGYYGCVYAGVPFILLPPPVDANKTLRFRAAIESAEPALVLTSNVLDHVLGGLPALASLLGRDPSGFLDINRAGDGASYRPVELTERSVAYIQYSSGSTSAPKGVIVSHGNVLANVEAGLRVIENNPPSRTYLLWAPVFHNVGLITSFSTVVAGMDCVWIKPMDFMAKPVRWFERITHHRADYTFASNSAVNYCTRAIQPDSIAGLDLSSLVSLGNGSEPIDMDTLYSFTNAFRSIGFKLEMFNPGYGLAEATSMASASTSGPVVRFVDSAALGRDQFVEVVPSHPKAKEIVAVGRLAWGNHGLIVDPDTGALEPDGTIGELWIRGPSNALGYWHHEDDTAHTFGATHPAAEGTYLRTGDLAAIRDGYLFITGRAKELIIINGHNFYSTDLQQTIKKEVPELKLVPFFTFSVAQDKREKVISVAEPVGIAPSEFRRLANEVVAAIGKTWEFSPDDILFVAEGSLPRTDTGKVQLLKLRQQYVEGKLQPVFSLRGAGGAERTAIAPTTETEAAVHALFTRLLGRNEPISTDDNFFQHGGDSLTSAELVAAIAQNHGVEIPLKLFLGQPTIAGIAQIIDSVKRGASVSQLRREKPDLWAEVALDESIRPIPGAPPPDRMNPAAVLITGGTGFVGAYLIRELIARTRAKIYCLVRAETEAAALDRLVRNAQHYRIWSEAWRDRLIPVIGDAGRPRLGLAPAMFEQLARTVDAIYHSAALLNFMYPYVGLKDVNVKGTEECLRLAALHRAKAFHHISTFSVFDNPSYYTGEAQENDPLESPDGYFVGYIESKWVAEKLVHLARSRGLSCSIYRPGEVSGDVVSGVWNEDAVVRNLVSTIQLGAMPDVAVRFRITPVDYVARGIVALSLLPESEGNAYNLVNQDSKSFRELAGFAREYGYPVALSPLPEWKERLFRADASNALKPLEPLFKDEGQNGVGGITERLSRAGAKISVAEAERLLRPLGIACPEVSSQLLSTYFRYFTEAGYLQPPPRR